MAEPGKETAATPPPPPQETVLQAPAPVVGPSLETATPISASQDTETAAGGAAALDSAQPKAESADQPPPPEVAAVGAPEQTKPEADVQPPVATMPQKVDALPPPAETPAQESAAPAAPTPPPPPQKQEGGVPEGAASVHEEKKDAPKARAKQEGDENAARRRWRRLRAAVCLLFLCPKSGETKPAATPPGVKKPEEEEKATAGEIPPPKQDSGSAARVPSRPEAGKGEGETKPAAAVDGKRPEPGKEQVVATLPPPAETSSQETATAAVAAEAEKQVAAPAPQQQEGGGAPEQAALSVPEEKKDAAPAPAPARPQEGEENRARRWWRRLQAAVRGGETKPPPPPPGETSALPVDSAGKPATEKGGDEMKPSSAQDGKKPVLSGQEEPKPVAEKKPSGKFFAGSAKKVKDDQTEESKARRRDETETQAGKPTKKLQMVIRVVQVFMSLFNKHRSPEKKEPAETASGPGAAGGEEDSKAKPEKKPSASPEKEKTTQHHRNWEQEEVRLEGILEEAFARLVAAEYVRELRGVRQKCLLTFSVFDLAAKVKKQSMIYWWVAEFDLPHRIDPPAAAGGGKNGSPAAPQGKGDSRNAADAEGIFVMLSDHGFLVPMKNWCSKVIHGCQVNPLVHWMLKRQARGDRFAELDDKGCPMDLQRNSGILCLTAGNRQYLQMMRMKDEPQPQAKKKEESQRPESQKSKKVTKEPSLQGKGSDDVQDQQQSTTTTTKDEAQVGSKSMAAGDREPSKKDEDPTQEAKDQQLAKDQQQQTTKDMVESIAEADKALVGNKSMSEADKAPSHKDEEPTQAKDQLTKGQQNINLSSERQHVDEILPQLFEGKKVILNVNAHVYPISKSAFSHLAECLVVLQLGRWNNIADDKTYMEVAGLDSQDAIGLLKNLRYLGLRGLSRLTELPKGIESLKKLVILDMRGCQNLVKVEASGNVFSRIGCDNVVTQQFYQKRSVITQLKQLTHLDLTECYMLEHIGRGITSLTELQVFKGFVFATGTQGDKACRIQDLEKLKKLQKLTISITTDANVAKGEMAHLKNITSLRKLTITWSEIPSILDAEKVKKKREELVERWTRFQLPEDLMKLDIRCYPKKELELERHEKLEKLYLRGGEMERFSTKRSDSIKTLRLRYLKKFRMEWKDIREELQNIEYVEIVVTNKYAKDIKDEECVEKLMNIPKFTLDGDGVWTKDQKEEQTFNKDASKI